MLCRYYGPVSADPLRASVLSVDDQSGFLAVMRELVEASDTLEAVAEAGSGEQAIELARQIEPDMVLMDVWLPGVDGIAAAREIKAQRPSTVVVLTSTMRPDELPPAAHDCLADALIWKSDLEPRLLDDIWLRTGNKSSPPDR